MIKVYERTVLKSLDPSERPLITLPMTQMFSRLNRLTAFFASHPVVNAMPMSSATTLQAAWQLCQDRNNLTKAFQVVYAAASGSVQVLDRDYHISKQKKTGVTERAANLHDSLSVDVMSLLTYLEMPDFRLTKPQRLIIPEDFDLEDVLGTSDLPDPGSSTIPDAAILARHIIRAFGYFPLEDAQLVNWLVSGKFLSDWDANKNNDATKRFDNWFASLAVLKGVVWMKSGYVDRKYIDSTARATNKRREFAMQFRAMRQVASLYGLRHLIATRTLGAYCYAVSRLLPDFDAIVSEFYRYDGQQWVDTLKALSGLKTLNMWMPEFSKLLPAVGPTPVASESLIWISTHPLMQAILKKAGHRVGWKNPPVTKRSLYLVIADICRKVAVNEVNVRHAYLGDPDIDPEGAMATFGLTAPIRSSGGVLNPWKPSFIIHDGKSSSEEVDIEDLDTTVLIPAQAGPTRMTPPIWAADPKFARVASLDDVSKITGADADLSPGWILVDKSVPDFDADSRMSMGDQFFLLDPHDILPISTYQGETLARIRNESLRLLALDTLGIDDENLASTVLQWLKYNGSRLVQKDDQGALSLGEGYWLSQYKARYTTRLMVIYGTQRFDELANDGRLPFALYCGQALDIDMDELATAFYVDGAFSLKDVDTRIGLLIDDSLVELKAKITPGGNTVRSSLSDRFEV